MKLVILAAGEGTRLRPLTDNIPKCMVPLEGRPLLERQIETAREVGITDIHVVCGYKSDVIDYPGITKHHNEAYATTNMVSSLFCAEGEFDDDIIIGYGDIVYLPDVIQDLMDSTAGVSVVVDRLWKDYWSARMSDPLRDAETLKISAEGNIIELGRKPGSYEDIEGQYIGLIKFSRESLPAIVEFYHSLEKDELYEGRTMDQMYMTTFLQLIADRLMPIKAVMVDNGWMEVDEPSDLEFTRFLRRENG